MASASSSRAFNREQKDNKSNSYSIPTAPSTKTSSFEENENILCFHGPLIYRAKILARRLEHDDPGVKGPLYYVHYQGWNKKWDEWVDDTRMLALNDDNLGLQKRTEEFYSVTKRPSKKQIKSKPSAPSTTPSRKRTREELEKEKAESDYLNKPEIRLDIPEALKCQLVDDWENITKNQQLVPLPRELTITQVLAQYKQHKMDRKLSKEWCPSLMDEVIQGLCTYFNKALGNVLLYQFERQQYLDIRKKHSNKDMTDIYGAEHLLRLFVQLPTLIAHTNMGKGTVAVLTKYLTDILKYMQKMQKQLFVTEYQNANPSYVSLVNGN